LVPEFALHYAGCAGFGAGPGYGCHSNSRIGGVYGVGCCVFVKRWCESCCCVLLAVKDLTLMKDFFADCVFSTENEMRQFG
jgi:hypothetical protein